MTRFKQPAKVPGTHLEPSDSVSNDLREKGEVSPQVTFHLRGNVQFRLTRSFPFLAPKENGGCSGNPEISLEGPSSLQL